MYPMILAWKLENIKTGHNRLGLTPTLGGKRYDLEMRCVCKSEILLIKSISLEKGKLYDSVICRT